MKKNTTTTTSKNEMVDVLSDKRSNLQDEILMLEKRRASLQKEIEELEETKRRGGVVASRVFSLQKQSSQISLDSVDNSSLSGGAGSGAAGNRRPLPRIPSHKSVGGNSNSGVLSRNNSSNTHLPPQPPMLLNLDLSSDAIFGGTSN